MSALVSEIKDHGGIVAFRSPLVKAHRTGDSWFVDIGGPSPSRIRATNIVNAGGLGAQLIAETIAGMAPQHIPGSWYAKGTYFSVSGPADFSRLIYPIPVAGGLGIHVTRDLSGALRLGPDVEWIPQLDYRVAPQKRAVFHEAACRYWPTLDIRRLKPAYAGVRPKIVPHGAPDQDFCIQTRTIHGMPGVVNLFGIESPGLTSALAIAETVAAPLLS